MQNEPGAAQIETVDGGRCNRSRQRKRPAGLDHARHGYRRQGWLIEYSTDRRPVVGQHQRNLRIQAGVGHGQSRGGWRRGQKESTIRIDPAPQPDGCETGRSKPALKGNLRRLPGQPFKPEQSAPQTESRDIQCGRIGNQAHRSIRIEIPGEPVRPQLRPQGRSIPEPELRPQLPQILARHQAAGVGEIAHRKPEEAGCTGKRFEQHRTGRGDRPCEVQRREPGEIGAASQPADQPQRAHPVPAVRRIPLEREPIDGEGIAAKGQRIRHGAADRHLDCTVVAHNKTGQHQCLVLQPVRHHGKLRTGFHQKSIGVETAPQVAPIRTTDPEHTEIQRLQVRRPAEGGHPALRNHEGGTRGAVVDAPGEGDPAIAHRQAGPRRNRNPVEGKVAPANSRAQQERAIAVHPQRTNHTRGKRQRAAQGVVSREEGDGLGRAEPDRERATLGAVALQSDGHHQPAKIQRDQIRKVEIVRKFQRRRPRSRGGECEGIAPRGAMDQDGLPIQRGQHQPGGTHCQRNACHTRDRPIHLHPHRDRAPAQGLDAEPANRQPGNGSSPCEMRIRRGTEIDHHILDLHTGQIQSWHIEPPRQHGQSIPRGNAAQFRILDRGSQSVDFQVHRSLEGNPPLAVDPCQRPVVRGLECWLILDGECVQVGVAVEAQQVGNRCGHPQVGPKIRRQHRLRQIVGQGSHRIPENREHHRLVRVRVPGGLHHGQQISKPLRYRLRRHPAQIKNQ